MKISEFPRAMRQILGKGNKYYVSKNNFNQLEEVSKVPLIEDQGPTDDVISQEQKPKTFYPDDSVMPSFDGMEDPKALEDYRQIELADGGVVEREGFDKGTDPRYFKGKVAEEITDAFIKAFQKDDISVLFNKTKANPDGILSQTASESINNKLIKNPKGIQSLVDATELDADTIYDMLDERDAFRDLDTRQVTMKNISAVGDSTKEILNEGEKWLIKNSKKYDNVNDLKKGFKRVFTKGHPFFQKQYTFSEGTLDNFRELFFGNITKSFASGYDDKGSPIGRYKISGKSTEDIFNASLYNFNPQVKNKVLNELKDLTSQDINKGSRTSLKKRLMSNKILSDLGINRNLTGPIARLLLKDINEDVLANLRNIKSRGYVIDELKYLKQLVDPKYKDQFDLVGKAIREAGRNKYEGAKQTLKIAENINYDHKIPQSIIDLGYADEIEYAKLNPIGEEFNKKIKNHEFDSKISRLIRNYEATPVKDRGKIVKEMNNLKKTFNKKYNNYLGDVSIKEINGKLNFSSSAKLITTPEGVTKQLTKNVKKYPGLFKINKQKRSQVEKLTTDIFGSIGCNPKYSDGGRVKFSNGSSCVAKGIKKVKSGNLTSADKKLIAKYGTEVAKVGGRGALLMETLGPLGVGGEALLSVADAYGETRAKGTPFKEAFADQIFSYLAPKDSIYYKDGVKQTSEDLLNTEIVKQRPGAEKYLYAKKKLDEYQQLKYENEIYDPDIDVGFGTTDERGPKEKLNTFLKEVGGQEGINELQKMVKPDSPFRNEYDSAKEMVIAKRGLDIEDTSGMSQEQRNRQRYADIGRNPDGSINPVYNENIPVERKRFLDANAQEALEQGAKEKYPNIKDDEIQDVIDRANLPYLSQFIDSETGDFDERMKPQLATGGRVGLDKGGKPKNPSRRTFIKGAGALGLAVAAFGTGALKLAKTLKTKTALETLAKPAAGQPEWFAPLVDKIITKGIYTKNLDKVDTYTFKEGDQTLKLIKEEPETFSNGYTYGGKIRIEVEAGGAFDQPFSMTYFPNDKYIRKGQEVPRPGFQVIESRPGYTAVGPGDFDLEDIEYVHSTSGKDTSLLELPKGETGILSDMEGLEKIATGKIKNPKLQKKRQEVNEKLMRNPTEDRAIEYYED